MTHKNIFLTLLTLCALSVTACSNSTIDIDNTPDVEQIPAPVPLSGQGVTFTTSADGLMALRQNNVALTTGSNMAPTTIELDPERTYQQMDGFGYAITYSTCYNLLKMTPEARRAFLTKTYSPTEGYGVSYARISIGCNDFSSTEYTLCDTEGLGNFALQRDETDFVIPILKEILAINPDLKIIAAPWTCPRWMKVADIETLAPHNSWTDGHLNPNYRQTYAEYFVKFVQAMKQEGISIYAVSPQNEPLNKYNCASLYMPWQEEAPFVKELAKAFKQSGVETQIYVFDHNYNYDNMADQEDYPVKVYNALGDSFEGSELVVGAAYHDYGGNNAELTDVFSKAPGKSLIFSESSIGTWNDGRNLAKRLMADMQNITLSTVNQQCKAVLVWNLMLDKAMGPNLDGGCQTCYGAVDIDQNGYTSISYNSHYYIIAQMASVVKPGATRLGYKRQPQVKGLSYAAFVNPDGTYAAVLCNASDAAQTITVSVDGRHCAVTVPANAVTSVRM